MDKELASGSVLTSEELRAAALTASARRGSAVARRRIVLRWSVWLAWRWLLPVIGLATVLATLLTFASIAFFGPAKVFDSSQTWLAEKLGLPKTKAPPSPFDDTLDNKAVTSPSFDATSGFIPKLQIDRNYSSYDQNNATIPVTPIVPNPPSPPKPPGAQP